ncbi:recombinase family protein [Erwinia tracheiphila]|uniref:recombinase family protein n=1 Tax=Erwinia tracheiphila TaxID=65700 RepID=UPI0021101EE1|nr:recombinase family protein [Erwinia tracheiphila]
MKRSAGHANTRSCAAAPLTPQACYVQAGDILIVWKLDRLGRSLPHLLDIINQLRNKNVQFRSLTEGMDTTTPSGELLFHLFGALAQYERSLTKERVIAGLEAANRRGKRGGRPLAITGEKLDAIVAALEGGMTKAAICRNFGVKRSTLIDTLNRLNKKNTTTNDTDRP